MTRFLAPRLAGFDYRGFHHYFITICSLHRRQVFTGDAPVDAVQRQLVRTSSLRDIGITAYVYMPDHLHVLAMGLRPDTDMRSWIQLFKQCSAFAWKRLGGGQLWQRSYYDRVLRSEEQAAVVARYLLMNPVRKGLCATPLAYPYLGSLTHDVDSLMTAAQDVGGEWRP